MAKVFQLSLEPSDKIRLENFIKNERNYYNQLVDKFSATVRNNPKALVNMTQAQEELYLTIARNGSSFMNEFRKGKLQDSYKKLGPSIVRDGLLNEAIAHIVDIPSSGLVLLPNTKAGMALEMLRHYSEQAQKNVSMLTKVDGSFTSSLQLLPIMLDNQKRHLQITKKDITVKVVDGETLIHFPYLKHVAKIDGIIGDDWNYAIVSNEDGRWKINFSLVKQKYLLKHTDRFYKKKL